MGKLQLPLRYRNAVTEESHAAFMLCLYFPVFDVVLCLSCNDCKRHGKKCSVTARIIHISMKAHTIYLSCRRPKAYAWPVNISHLTNGKSFIIHLFVVVQLLCSDVHIFL